MQDDVKAGGPEDAGGAKSEDWMAKLLATNPWAGGLKLDEGDDAFTAARKAASIERFEAGRGAWNKWADAMADVREALKASGAWDMETDGLGWAHPKTVETMAWLSAASTDFRGHRFKGDADFRNFVFPGNAAAAAEDGGKPRAVFGVSARFESAKFEGEARFGGAKFEGEARFGGATFEGEARFEYAMFEGYADFDKATFKGFAGFGGATFEGEARFGGATFEGEARFESATFEGEARFDEATFEGEATFGGAKFEGGARFASATFEGLAWLRETTFEGGAWFDKATFDSAWFDSATFDYATFGGATFKRKAQFASAMFKGGASFASATFKGGASFTQATLDGYSSFANARFEKGSRFTAIRSQRAFTLEGANFVRVPDFIQAHFAEAPRFDNLHFHRGLVEPGGFWSSIFGEVKPDVISKYRALKRLAVQGHDHEREQLFFAGELRSERSLRGRDVDDKPNIRRLMRPKWYFNLLYELLADFGRSLFRPLALWLASIGFMLYTHLAEHFARATDPKFDVKLQGHSDYGYGSDVLAWLTDAFFDEMRDIGSYFGVIDFTQLSGTAAAKLQGLDGINCVPFLSALHLSVKKAMLVLGWEAAEKFAQDYTCLYGVPDSYRAVQSGGKLTGELVANIPNSIVFWQTGQTIVSAVLIFLFLLALRNHFRIK